MSRRVLLATDAVGGVWTYTVELARALRETGIDPVIAARGPSPNRHQLAQAASIDVFDTGLALDWLAERPQELSSAGRTIAQLATDVEADVVQLHSAALACDAEFDQPLVVVQHSCVATWWDCVRKGPLPDDFSWRRDMIECGLNRADAIVAPTAAFAAQTARTYDLSRPVHAVHNGRRPIALPSRAPADFILTTGRLWDEGKNVRTLDRAAELIDAPIEAVGPRAGPNGASIELEHVSAPGSLGERAVAERLATRPIFASSALYEPFGYSALEAAQAGCALVLSDIPAFRELWDRSAIFVDPNDAVAFADAFRRLLQDPDERARLGRASQLRALRYTADAMGRQMFNIYGQVAQAKEALNVPLAIAGAA